MTNFAAPHNIDNYLENIISSLKNGTYCNGSLTYYDISDDTGKFFWFSSDYMRENDDVSLGKAKLNTMWGDFCYKLYQLGYAPTFRNKRVG